MLLQFLLPYSTICLLASWGLAQNLEGLGLFKYLNVAPVRVGELIAYPMTLSPYQGIAALSVLLTGLLTLVFLLNVRACFYLGNRIGVAGLAVWLIPGVLSLCGYVPDVRAMGPDVFRFNEGFPGGMESAAANLAICLVGGWSAILLLSSFWKRNDFKNAYDHLWYTLGLIAALYFVVDAGLSSYKEDFANADARMVRVLQLYGTAGQHLEVLCALPETPELSPALCALAPRLTWSVASYLELKGNLRAKIDLPDWTAQLGGDPALARQIQALNTWACVQGQQPKHCQRIPMDMALSDEDATVPLAFPPPEYAKAIQQFHASMEKSNRRIHDIEQGHNLRYFGFLIVAFLAGGKLANASRAMVTDDVVRPPSWTGAAFKYAGKKSIALLKCLTTTIATAYRCLARHAVALHARNKAARTARLEQRKNAVAEKE